MVVTWNFVAFGILVTRMVSVKKLQSTCGVKAAFIEIVWKFIIENL